MTGPLAWALWLIAAATMIFILAPLVVTVAISFETSLL
jgi:ABC-type spermidine/putrescine transport system permease subunit II